MATKKFSELTVLDTVNANLVLTVIPVYDISSNTTRKVTLQQINDSIEANIPFAAAAFTQANTPSQVANSASSYANAAFLKANTANTDAANADNKAVSAGVYANSAYGVANTANTNSFSAGVYANAAFAVANSGITDSWARDSVNAASSYANSGFTQANTANTLAQAAYNAANSASSGLTANSVATLNNKTFDVSISSNNIFSIQGQSITSYSGSGQVLILQNSPTISVLNLSDSQLNLDGGTGSLYWSGQSGVAQAGDLKAGVYSSDPTSNNSLFTFGGAGANVMSVGIEGSLFIGTARPTNNGGLNTTFPGWLVVQSGAKFGGTINTLGALQFDDPVTGKIIFADSTEQNTAYQNIVWHTANSAANYANAAFAAANSASSGTDSWARDSANSASSYANSGYNQANTTNNIAQAAYNTANSVTSNITGNVLIDSTNTAIKLTANGSGETYLTLTKFGITTNTQMVLSAENAVTGNNSTILFDKDGSGIVFRLEDTTPVSKNWGFYQGKLTFPDSTEQTTAYTGTAGSYANSAYTAANTADQRAVTSGNYANSAYAAANTFSGFVSGSNLSVSGNVVVTGNVVTSKIVYATNTAVTQTTSRSTGVTLNNTSGQVTLYSDSMTSGEVDVVSVTNNKVRAGDIILTSVEGGSVGSYVSGGYCSIDGIIILWITNITSSSTASESPTIRFIIVQPSNV